MDQQPNTDNKEQVNTDTKKRYSALIAKWSKLTSGKNAYFRITPIILILIALPLIVLLSLQQQELRQRAASSDCNTGLSCTGCTASSSNTCSYGNGKETCTYQASLDGSACNPKTFSDVYCYLPNNCSNGFTCSNQQCVSTSQPTPTPTANPSSSSIYGTGLGGDTRNNHQVGTSSHYKVDYRFRATVAAVPSTLSVSERGNGGANTYSGGNGGTIRATIQTDSNGLPSGTVVATTQWNPGNPSGNWEVWPPHSFSGASTLTKGQLYHIVFENVANDPATNYISLNSLFTYSGTVLKPVFGDDLALQQASPTTWSLQSRDIPIFDLTYANGAHDGMNYIGCMVDMTYVGVISGTSQMVRETLNVTGGNRTVNSVSVRVRRSSGSSPLVIRLEKSDGTTIEEVSVPASSIAQSAAGGDNGGSVWANANFTSPHVLTSGQSYNLVLKTASGTEYTAAPLQEGTSKGMHSYAYTDGVGQRTTNGSSWSGLYGSEADVQFYFK